MRRRWTVTAFVWMLLFSFSVHAMNFEPEETYRSVVVVYTDHGFGSGFFVDEQSVITNAHVVENQKNVTIRLYDESTLAGTVMRIDRARDLALVKVAERIVPLRISTEPAYAGQEVYAIGAPKDMLYTITKGIVSSPSRRFGDTDYIQVDASINAGNSGGPIVDENGQVIGVVTSKAFDAEGIGFAVSAVEVSNFMAGVSVSGSEEAEPPGTSDGSDIPQGEYSTNSEHLMRENDRLKVAVCILGIGDILLLLLLFLAKRPKKTKNTLDFEIEIEE